MLGHTADSPIHNFTFFCAPYTTVCFTRSPVSWRCLAVPFLSKKDFFNKT